MQRSKEKKKKPVLYSPSIKSFHCLFRFIKCTKSLNSN